jgi:hypothetical protein
MKTQLPPPQDKKARAKKSKLLVAWFNSEGHRVKCWYDIKDKTICFRVLGSRRITRMGLATLYVNMVGQQLMPFAKSIL